MNSAALIADGYHARTDGLTSLAVVLGALGVWFGFPLADPIVGLLITVAILGIVWQSAKAIITRSLDGIAPNITAEIRHAAEHVPGAKVTDIKARWLGHKLTADLTIAVDQSLSVVDANKIAYILKDELAEHLPPLGRTTVQFDTGAAEGAPLARAHYHAPEPLPVNSPLASGVLAIIDTPEGERMRLTVTRHAGGLKAVVNIIRPGGVVEVLNLLPVPNDRHAFQSTVEPAEPHEFDATLDLTARAEKDSCPFHMSEPDGHPH